MDKNTRALNYQIADYKRAKIKFSEQLQDMIIECSILKSNIQEYLRRGGTKREDLTPLFDEAEQFKNDLSLLDLKV